MKRVTLLAVVATAFVAACSEPAKTGDAARGAQLHEVCLDCHGTSVYTRQDRKVKSLSTLRQETARWGDYYNPALSAQDVDDITAYLNKEFYKF